MKNLFLSLVCFTFISAAQASMADANAWFAEMRRQQKASSEPTQEKAIQVPDLGDPDRLEQGFNPLPDPLTKAYLKAKKNDPFHDYLKKAASCCGFTPDKRLIIFAAENIQKACEDRHMTSLSRSEVFAQSFANTTWTQQQFLGLGFRTALETALILSDKPTNVGLLRNAAGAVLDCSKLVETDEKK